MGFMGPSWQRMFETILYMCMAVLHGNFHLPWTRSGKQSLKLFCIRVWYYMEISIEPFWQRMFKTILYLWMSIPWKFPWTLLAKSECLQQFCISVWYYMEISMKPFWQRMFKTILYLWMRIPWKFPWTLLAKNVWNYFVYMYGITWKFSWNRFGKECLKLFCIHVWYYMEISVDPFWQTKFETVLYTCLVLHGNFRRPVLAKNVWNYFVYVFSITWKFPWTRSGKQSLKLFCISIWYYMEISMESFWQRMFELFCIHVWYYMEISMDHFGEKLLS